MSGGGFTVLLKMLQVFSNKLWPRGNGLFNHQTVGYFKALFAARSLILWKGKTSVSTVKVIDLG
jgi:hypothetical protein